MSKSVQDPYLTVDQVADFFQVSPYTIREWLKGGDLFGIKLGNRWRIQQSEVHRFANKKFGDAS